MLADLAIFRDAFDCLYGFVVQDSAFRSSYDSLGRAYRWVSERTVDLSQLGLGVHCERQM